MMKSRIMIYSKEGMFVRSRLHKEFVRSGNVTVFIVKSFTGISTEFMLLETSFLNLMSNWRLYGSVELPFSSRVTSYQADLDGDGKDEFLLYSEEEKKLAVYNAGLHKLTELEFSTDT